MATGSPHIAIAGGGAAGYFAAITCAEANPAAKVTLFEATAHSLAKVKVSGGGRCNVTHSCFEPRELVKRYPRGSRELLGAFHRWQPRDTVAWFEARGVPLKTEGDGRMFPATDSSQTIIDCLQSSAARAGVHVAMRCGLNEATPHPSGGFDLKLSDGQSLTSDRLLIATGGGRAAHGLGIAEKLGHTIEPPVPSLFTFNIEDPRLRDLAGLSVPSATASIPGTQLRETGPLLVTHWGLSGPAILKLSAWGARELHARDYKFVLSVNWLGNAGTKRHEPKTADQVRSDLMAARNANPKKQVTSWNPFGLPQRLWERLVEAAGITPTAIWTSTSNQLLSALANQLTTSEFAVTGKSTNKDEFVTCGGVRLSEIDFKTMESRICPGLHFAGEVLDIDGITGGFNFQAAWTTGRLAGLAMAEG